METLRFDVDGFADCLGGARLVKGSHQPVQMASKKRDDPGAKTEDQNPKRCRRIGLYGR